MRPYLCGTFAAMLILAGVWSFILLVLVTVRP
jgi:hypothetical protein